MTKNGKISVYPYQKNTLILRIENTYDIFDCVTATKDECLKQ